MTPLITWAQLGVYAVAAVAVYGGLERAAGWLVPRAGSVWDDRHADRLARQIIQARAQMLQAQAEGDIVTYAAFRRRYESLGGVR